MWNLHIKQCKLSRSVLSLIKFITVILPFLAVSVVFSTAVIVDTVVVIKHLTSIYWDQICMILLTLSNNIWVSNKCSWEGKYNRGWTSWLNVKKHRTAQLWDVDNWALNIDYKPLIVVASVVVGISAFVVVTNSAREDSIITIILLNDSGNSQ